MIAKLNSPVVTVAITVELSNPNSVAIDSPGDICIAHHTHNLSFSGRIGLL
jgi:hypothetical protein